MSLRPPQYLTGHGKPDTGLNVLDYELAQERAQTLGRVGDRVEDALARLRAFDAQGGDGSGRAALVDEAADRVWALMVQRELCGLRHWEATVRAYGIPQEVLNRMGRVARTPATRP